MVDGGGCLLVIVGGHTEEHVHHAVALDARSGCKVGRRTTTAVCSAAGELAVGAAVPREITLGGAVHLLVLGIAVIAEAELHGMLAGGVGNVALRLIVLSG